MAKNHLENTKAEIMRKIRRSRQSEIHHPYFSSAVRSEGNPNDTDSYAEREMDTCYPYHQGPTQSQF